MEPAELLEPGPGSGQELGADRSLESFGCGAGFLWLVSGAVWLGFWFVHLGLSGWGSTVVCVLWAGFCGGTPSDSREAVWSPCSPFLGPCRLVSVPQAWEGLQGVVRSGLCFQHEELQQS